jgi:thioesterase-3
MGLGSFILKKKTGGTHMQQHLFNLTVRSTDVDFIGHVNNAKYLEYMEWARFDWICQLGLSLEELQRRAIMPVVVNIVINYRKELRMLEQVQVRSSAVRMGEKSFVIRQELFNQKGELACDADITMVMMDAKTRRATALPDEFVRVFSTVSAVRGE